MKEGDRVAIIEPGKEIVEGILSKLNEMRATVRYQGKYGMVGHIVDTKYICLPEHVDDKKREVTAEAEAKAADAKNKAAAKAAAEAKAAAAAEKKAAAEAEAKARIEEGYKTAFGLKFYMFGNGRSVRAVPTEEFWAEWKRNRSRIKSTGYWVEKGVTYMVYARKNFGVDLLDVEGLEKPIQVSWKPQPDHQPTDGDDYMKGQETFNPSEASDLRAETPSEYERRRDFEEDGYGDR